MDAFELNEEALLSRQRFSEAVLGRRGGLCCMCDSPAVDAHHILDRKLFSNGGYYMSNGAAVCEFHHWRCETTVISLHEVRAAARVHQVVLPARLAHVGFDAQLDKWGNLLLGGIWAGYRITGPLASDTGMNRALAAAGLTKWLLREMPTGT